MDAIYNKEAVQEFEVIHLHYLCKYVAYCMALLKEVEQIWKTGYNYSHLMLA